MLRCERCNSLLEVIAVVEFVGGVREDYICPKCKLESSHTVYFESF
ncbi:MAG: hypothetical protein R6V17_00110 [Halanaerobacter sp.]